MLVEKKYHNQSPTTWLEAVVFLVRYRYETAQVNTKLGIIYHKNVFGIITNAIDMFIFCAPLQLATEKDFFWTLLLSSFVSSELYSRQGPWRWADFKNKAHVWRSLFKTEFSILDQTTFTVFKSRVKIVKNILWINRSNHWLNVSSWNYFQGHFIFFFLPTIGLLSLSFALCLCL